MRSCPAMSPFRTINQRKEMKETRKQQKLKKENKRNSFSLKGVLERTNCKFNVLVIY